MPRSARISGYSVKALDAAQLNDAFSRAYSRRGARSLGRLVRAFGLKKAEAGRLFNVTRQSVDEWMAKGVPLNRTADVERVASLATTLQKRFKPERLPQIVRAPMPGLDDESILKTIQTRGVVPVFEMLERAFSYQLTV